MSEWPIDWPAVVEEAKRRRKVEGLSQRSLADLAGVSVPTVNAFEQGEIRMRFERVVAILEAVGMFIQPGEPDSFEAFRYNARKRWEKLVVALPVDHPSRQPMGFSEHAYALGGLERRPTSRELQRVLEAIPKSSGWTPFWVPTRGGLRPSTDDGVVECWLGQPAIDRVFNDPAHSDFWQVSREGFAYLHRGYQEDGPGNLEPGTIFDLTLPIWRTAEVLLHAANLARALGGNPKTSVHLTVRYTGLEGRELISWATPLLRTVIDRRHRARSGRVDLDILTDVEKIETELEHVVSLFLDPLYERFDGYEISTELVVHQIAELRRQPGFGIGTDGASE